MFSFLQKRKTNVILILTLLLIAGAGIGFVSMRQTSKEWRDVRSRIMPQFMPVANKALIDLVAKPFAEDVDIGFVVDAETKYQFVDHALMEQWGVDEDMLYDQALNNLEARSRNINVEVAEASEDSPNAKYVIVELDDGYAATRSLSGGGRRAIARELGDEYFAAIPTRDFLIFWHKEFPLFDAFAKQVEVEYRAETTYPLTPKLFVISRAGIQQVDKIPK